MPTTVRHTPALVLLYRAKSLKEKAAATSVCNRLRTTIPLEQVSEIDRQPNHVRGCDNARHLRMAGVVTIGHRFLLQASTLSQKFCSRFRRFEIQKNEGYEEHKIYTVPPGDAIASGSTQRAEITILYCRNQGQNFLRRGTREDLSELRRISAR